MHAPHAPTPTPWLPRFSLLRLSGLARVGLASGLVILIWLGVLWTGALTP